MKRDANSDGVIDRDEFRVLFHQARDRKICDLYALVVRDMMMVVVLFHPFVSGKAMRAFQCKEVQPSSPNGTVVSYLETDMRIVCFGSDWAPIAALAGCTLFFFSLGAPAVIFFVLWRRRHKLGEEMTFKRLGIMYVRASEYMVGLSWWRLKAASHCLSHCLSLSTSCDCQCANFPLAWNTRVVAMVILLSLFQRLYSTCV